MTNPKQVKRIGIMGGGQLGRMLALSADRLGLSCLALDPSYDACAGQVTPHLVAGYEDQAALRLFTGSIDVATYEFENVPVAAAEAVARKVPLYPSVRALQVTGDRLLEKQLLNELRIPTAQWAPVSSAKELATAGEELGFPLLLKTRRNGYDGKGQALIQDAADATVAWKSLRRQPCIAERLVTFRRELSLISVRSALGEVAHYPLVQNRHEGGILRFTEAPAPGSSFHLQQQAESIATRLLTSLNYVGVLAVELFDCEEGLLVNELAPRVHNSGHWTLEGAVTSQFENHLRAIAALPLGPTTLTAPSAMLNLIGDVPPVKELSRLKGVHVHPYGKLAAPGRKLGHVTVTANNETELARQVARVQRHLTEHVEREPLLNAVPRFPFSNFSNQPEERV